MRNVSAKKKLGEEFDCYIHTVLFFSGIISVSRALSKSKWKKNLPSLESEIMMWMCRYFDCLHTVVTQKPLLRVLFLFECDINWKRKKFSSFPPLSLTQCLMASLESSYQHRIFLLLFLPSFKHTFSSYFFSSTLSQFFLIIIFFQYRKVFPFLASFSYNS